MYVVEEHVLEDEMEDLASFLHTHYVGKDTVTLREVMVTETSLVLTTILVMKWFLTGMINPIQPSSVSDATLTVIIAENAHARDTYTYFQYI